MPLACFGRSQTSSPDQGASIVTTSQPSQQQLQQDAHRWLDSIARNYKKIPGDALRPSYLERAGLVYEDAKKLIQESPSSENNAKLRCHAQEVQALREEMESIQKHKGEGKEQERSGDGPEYYAVWKKAPCHTGALEWAFFQLKNIWTHAPADLQAQLDLGSNMNHSDPESVFKMRPVYEQLVDSFKKEVGEKNVPWWD